MNKKILFSGVIFCSIVLAGCAGTGEVKETVEQPVEDASNYVPQMVDINKKAHEDINNAVKQENKRLQNALGEGNTGNVKGDSSEDNNLSKKYMKAVLKTSLGDIKIKFYADDAPATVNNFLKLASEKFYDGTKFHRVIKGFMIQGGDPLSKDDSLKNRWGTSGPGYSFKDEFNSHKLVKGSLAMANSGPNTNGSQFFIVTADATPWLDGKHTNFGEVVSGLDIVQKIENVQTGANDRPAENVVLKSLELLEK